MQQITITFMPWDNPMRIKAMEPLIVLVPSTTYQDWASEALPGGFAPDDPHRIMQYIQEEILTTEWREKYNVLTIDIR